MKDKNVQGRYDIFLEFYNKACDKFLKKCNDKQNFKIRPKWMDKEIKAIVRRKASLWQKYIKGRRGRNQLLEEYKICSKLARNSIREAIRNYEMNIASRAKHQPKLLYSYIKDRQQVKESIRTMKGDDGVCVSDRGVIAEILNRQFKSVFNEDKGEELPEFKKRTDNSFNVSELKLFILDDLIKRLEKLDETSAPGVDMVTSMVLKKCAEELGRPLQIIFSTSYKEGEMPDEWRRANVTPIFKSGSKLDAVNYRPVSLTVICCKIMEGCLRDSLTEYLYVNGLISAEQHGFVRRKACVTNLLECQNLITKSIWDNKAVDIVYTDFSKAFDKVAHRKLLHKMKAYGIDGLMGNWVGAFLRGRKQRVILGDEESSWQSVTSSVPQGSVLGPLLFVIFINDLPEGLTNRLLMYADDSKIIAESELNKENGLQEDLNKVVDWCDTWSMSLNAAKCKVMHCGKNNPTRAYWIGDTPLAITEKEKDLGVIITSNGKFSEQAEAAVGKANRMLGVMRKTFRYFDIRLFNIIYPTFVRPHLEFASAVWNSLSVKDTRRIEGVQRRATKMVTELRGMDYNLRLKELGLTTLETRRKRGDLIQIFKIVKGLEEVELGVRIGKSRPGLSHMHQIGRDNGKCTLRSDFLPNRTATTWNLLPSHVVNAEKVNSFKARLDSHIALGLLRRSVYTK